MPMGRKDLKHGSPLTLFVLIESLWLSSAESGMTSLVFQAQRAKRTPASLRKASCF